MPLVYYVEDDQSISYIIEKTIENANYSGVGFNRGMPFLETFKKKVPDLILLDVMLPGQDGIAVCQEIRAVSGTPIIMLTAKTETQDVVLGLEAGADDYIVKPFDETDLKVAIELALYKFSMEKQEVIQLN
jgi:two-component system response regulator MtrA